MDIETRVPYDLLLYCGCSIIQHSTYERRCKPRHSPVTRKPEHHPSSCRHGHVTSPHLTAGTQMPSGRCIKQWHLEAFPVPEIGKAQCNLHGLHTQACNCFMPVPMRCEHDWKPPVDATRLTLAGHLGWRKTKLAAVLRCLVRTWTCLIDRLYSGGTFCLVHIQTHAFDMDEPLIIRALDNHPYKRSERHEHRLVLLLLPTASALLLLGGVSHKGC